MEPDRRFPILLACSVELEAGPLIDRVSDPEDITVGRRSAVSGRIAGRDVVVLITGMGKTNMAQAVTAALERWDVASVVNFGVGGAYSGSGMGLGSIVLATAENYGDEGVTTPDGWISTEGIGIPLLDQNGTPNFNELALDPVRVKRALADLAGAGLRAGSGRFVTVSCCSGTTRRGEEMEGRFGAVCETMEGAAAAHVAALYGTPFLEIRAISNMVEDRDLSRWKLPDAARAAAAGAYAIVSRGAADRALVEVDPGELAR